MIGRVVIYSVLLTAIWLLSIQIIYPAISEMFTPITIWIKLVMCLGTLLLMTPFMGAHLQQIQLFGIIPEAMERRELQSRTPGFPGSGTCICCSFLYH